jgi:hypothetical protein
VIFTQTLEFTEIFVADRMPLSEGRTLELTWANLGNIVGQFGSDSVFQLYCLPHDIFNPWKKSDWRNNSYRDRNQ